MRILIADDEPLILNGMVRTVQRAAPDAEVEGFTSSSRALEWSRDNAPDVAFLDIEMPEINGLQLAKELRLMHPQLNVVFTTSYPQYAMDSYDLRASGYLLKPVSESDVRRELADLRFSPVRSRNTGLRLRTFGNFEAFNGANPLHFRYSRTLELLAYLTDRNGAFCTNGEIEGALWEDLPPTESYLRQLRKDLIDTLEAAGYDGVIEQRRAAMRLVPEKVTCDYFDFLAGDPAAHAVYRGDYMSQYSWAEQTNGWLTRENANRK